MLERRSLQAPLSESATERVKMVAVVGSAGIHVFTFLALRPTFLRLQPFHLFLQLLNVSKVNGTDGDERAGALEVSWSFSVVTVTMSGQE